MIPIFHNNNIFYITVRPESRPEILGFFDEYTLDKAIDALCTSKRSYPAAQLDFFINDEPVSLGIIYAQYLGNSPFGPWAGYFLSFLLTVLLL